MQVTKWRIATRLQQRALKMAAMLAPLDIIRGHQFDPPVSLRDFFRMVRGLEVSVD